jgi:hypothetical protein
MAPDPEGPMLPEPEPPMPLPSGGEVPVDEQSPPPEQVEDAPA